MMYTLFQNGVSNSMDNIHISGTEPSLVMIGQKKKENSDIYIRYIFKYI